MTTPPINLEVVPEVLKSLPQWVCWKWGVWNGKRTKVPYQPKNGSKASTNDPITWDTLEAALAAYARGGFAGIGFVFANNNLIGIDLDHCIKDGVLHPDAERIVKTCNSYTEYSVSGDGLHIILVGTKNTTECVRSEMPWGGECAVWEVDRFFVMTGRPYGEYPAIPQPRQAELNAVCALVWPYQSPEPAEPVAAPKLQDPKLQAEADNTYPAGDPGEPIGGTCEGMNKGDDVQAAGKNAQPVVMQVEVRPAQVPPRPIPVFTDDEIIEILSKTALGKEFRALWEGRWNSQEGRKNSLSEADYHLCRHLAYCTKDAAQIDRLYRRSALMRPKWDVGRAGKTYGDYTIKKVLGRVTSQYRGRLHKHHPPMEEMVDAKSPEANVLLTRAKALVGELKTQPDITRLPAAIADFLWRLPDLYLDVIKKDLADCLNGSFKVSSFNKAIQTERAQRKKQPASIATVAKAKATAEQSALRNHTVEAGVDQQGNPREFTRALPIAEIGAALYRQVGDWPRRAGGLLFVDQSGVIRHLERQEELFAWVQENMPLFWAPGQDSAGQSLTTKAEFVSHLEATSMQYAAVEELPHEPPIKAHYYAWRKPENYAATGERLGRLLAYFDNPEGPEDAILIKAALMTPAWGGMPGKRPAVVIMAPDRGCGKSTLANVIGHLYGGHIELALTTTAEDKLITRLLTPSSMTQRVVRVDNIKCAYGSAFLEGLITAPIISGHRMYHGEASRPNTLTFVLTGNALRLSRDIAERAFIIRLIKPHYRPAWESEVMNFVSENRDLILADIITQLQKPAQSIVTSDRYADWVQGVLARCEGDIDGVIRLNAERRDACDEDQEDAVTIMEAIDQDLAQRHGLRLMNIQQQGESAWDVEPQEWEFITSTEMTEILRKALNEPLSARAVKSRLNGHIEAGRLPRVLLKRTNASRGYMVQRSSSASTAE